MIGVKESLLLHLCFLTLFLFLFLLFLVVREAQDACIWLKSAGFPQYVQSFESKDITHNYG